MKTIKKYLKRWFQQYLCSCGGTITETERGESCDKCGHFEYYP